MTEPPDRAWVEQAACHDEPARLFTDPADDSDVRTALATCQRCPVRQPCLDTALAHRTEADVGIWGGTTEDQRRQIRRGRLQPDIALDANNPHGRNLPDAPPSTAPQPRPHRRPPREIPRLAAPEITVALDKHGDYVSADGRVLIFRTNGHRPWALAVDDQIIATSRTVTEARRIAWTTLHETRAATVPVPEPAGADALSRGGLRR